MEPRYSKAGNVILDDESSAKKRKFDWAALFVWLFSLVASLLPIYLSALLYFRDNGTLDNNFWHKCFVEYDILWVFGTVLLFTCINPITSMVKNTARSRAVNVLTILGIMLFFITEATWLFFKYTITTEASWVRWLGCILIVLTIIISTPLQINFIKGEG